MKTICCLVVGCAFLLDANAVGGDKNDENKLPDAVLTALQKSGELELYSLDGDKKDKEGWRGWKVLGKTTVKKDEAVKLAGVVKKGVEEGDSGARCFIPRHGIRVTHDGKSYDLVICFECHWVYVYTDGSDKPQVFMTSESPQKPINKILTDAKVPLAKPEK